MRRVRRDRVCSFSICIGALILAVSIRAQTPRPPTLVSPDVASDRTVTFRLYAPQATEVQISGEWMGPSDKPLPLSKREDGVWTVSAGPFEPNVYSYGYIVNGVRVPLDPSSPTTLISANRYASSSFLIPGKPPKAWELRPVPRGTVHIHYFRSTRQDRDRPYYV